MINMINYYYYIFFYSQSNRCEMYNVFCRLINHYIVFNPLLCAPINVLSTSLPSKHCAYHIVSFTWNKNLNGSIIIFANDFLICYLYFFSRVRKLTTFMIKANMYPKSLSKNSCFITIDLLVQLLIFKFIIQKQIIIYDG